MVLVMVHRVTYQSTPLTPVYGGRLEAATQTATMSLGMIVHAMSRFQTKLQDIVIAMATGSLTQGSMATIAPKAQAPAEKCAAAPQMGQAPLLDQHRQVSLANVVPKHAEIPRSAPRAFSAAPEQRCVWIPPQARQWGGIARPAAVWLHHPRAMNLQI
jgi:hypothetical protein